MDIHNIPYEVVIDFLEKHHPDLIYDDNYYDVLLDLLLSGEVDFAPSEIINWVIAYNNRDNENIGMLKLSDILLDKIDLSELYEILNVNTKDDVIQILSYLHKLDDDLSIFNKLPTEILEKILLNLDLGSLLLWFKTYKSTNLYGKTQLDNILRSKIALDSDIDTKNLNSEQLMILADLLEKDEYYGIIQNNIFRIIKNNLDEYQKSFDKRVLNKGRTCNNYRLTEIFEILWKLRQPLSDNAIIFTEDDRENIIQQLLGNIKFSNDDGKIVHIPIGLSNSYLNYDDMKKWDLEKLILIYNLTRSKLRREKLCEMIKGRMDELGFLKYL